MAQRHEPCEGVEIKLHIFFTSALYVGDWSGPLPVPLWFLLTNQMVNANIKSVRLSQYAVRHRQLLRQTCATVQRVFRGKCLLRGYYRSHCALTFLILALTFVVQQYSHLQVLIPNNVFMPASVRQKHLLWILLYVTLVFLVDFVFNRFHRTNPDTNRRNR